MEKCASHSARAGESNASINGPVGILRTQPPSVLSIHPHHIGFFENFAHTHTRGCVFLSKSIHAGKSTKNQKNMEKCASHSARAGESNATFTGWIGPLLTQARSILSLRTHPVGFFRNFAHTHTRGCVFCQNRSMLENQQKFRKM